MNKRKAIDDSILYCEAPVKDDYGFIWPCVTPSGLPRRGAHRLDLPGAPVLCYEHARQYASVRHIGGMMVTAPPKPQPRFRRFACGCVFDQRAQPLVRVNGFDPHDIDDMATNCPFCDVP